ncbi:MAG: hypothetical protein Q9226_009347, partial [Calogaya cf. arnoldii]
VAPGRGAQVYYNISPPEAIADNSLEDASDVASEKSALPTRKPRKVLAIAILSALVLLTVALSVGLGVGLKKQRKAVLPPASPDLPKYTTYGPVRMRL